MCILLSVADSLLTFEEIIATMVDAGLTGAYDIEAWLESRGVDPKALERYADIAGSHLRRSRRRERERAIFFCGATLGIAVAEARARGVATSSVLH